MIKTFLGIKDEETNLYKNTRSLNPIIDSLLLSMLSVCHTISVGYTYLGKSQ